MRGLNHVQKRSEVEQVSESISPPVQEAFLYHILNRLKTQPDSGLRLSQTQGSDTEQSQGSDTDLADTYIEEDDRQKKEEKENVISEKCSENM